jgi:hypothetical protein
MDEANLISSGGTASKLLPLDPNILSAADDAWMEFLVISEELQTLQLSEKARGFLLEELIKIWRLFQSRTEQLNRQIEEYCEPD